MKTTKLICLIGAAVIVTGTAQAQVTKTGNKFSFRTKYVKGQSMSYTMAMKMQVQGKTQPVTMTFAEKVKDVDKSGNATIEVSGSMMPNPTVVKLDPHGRPLGGGNLPSNGMALPEKPIAVGESWTGNVNNSSMGMGVGMTARYTLKGFKSVGGKQCAEIAVTMTMSAKGKAGAAGPSSMSGAGSGVSYVVMSDGSLQSSQMSMTMKMAGAKGGPQNMQMQMAVTRN